jgi:hypothetical protein
MHVSDHQRKIDLSLPGLRVNYVNIPILSQYISGGERVCVAQAQDGRSSQVAPSFTLIVD